MQRYGEFSTNLLENWTKVLSMKKEERVANPSKLRVDLRLYSELVSAGIFTLKEGLPLLGEHCHYALHWCYLTDVLSR